MPDDLIPALGGYDDAALDQAFRSLTADLERAAGSLDGADAVEHFRLEWLGRKHGRLKTVSDAWLKTVSATGVSCALVSRLVAVTMISAS